MVQFQLVHNQGKLNMEMIGMHIYPGIDEVSCKCYCKTEEEIQLSAQ